MNQFARNRVMSAFVATCFALSASVVFAQSKYGPADGESAETNGQIACRTVGCPNGNRVCGEATWVEDVLLPTDIPVVVPIRMLQTCYEVPPNW